MYPGVWQYLLRQARLDPGALAVRASGFPLPVSGSVSWVLGPLSGRLSTVAAGGSAGFPLGVRLLLKGTHFLQLHRKKPNSKTGVLNTGCVKQASHRDKCCEIPLTRGIRSGQAQRQKAGWCSPAGWLALAVVVGREVGGLGPGASMGWGKENCGRPKWPVRNGGHPVREPRVSIWREESRRVTGCGRHGRQ